MERERESVRVRERGSRRFVSFREKDCRLMNGAGEEEVVCLLREILREEDHNAPAEA